MLTKINSIASRITASTTILLPLVALLQNHNSISTVSNNNSNSPSVLLFAQGLKMPFTSSSTTSTPMSSKVALGAGCYWGTEKYIKKDFQSKFPNSIRTAKVGFMSPNPNAIKNPSYRQVCSGSTGHIEVLDIELNNPNEHFEELLKFFFQFHDPTTKDRQGNDVGSQYGSVIFVYDEHQERIANNVKEELQMMISEKKFLGSTNPFARDIVETNIVKANEFYEAHEEHQEYLMKNPYGYCNHYIRMKEWPSK